MTLEQWERRYACALGMALYVHITRDEWAMTFFGISMCIFFAYIPAIRKRLVESKNNDQPIS